MKSPPLQSPPVPLDYASPRSDRPISLSLWLIFWALWSALLGAWATSIAYDDITKYTFVWPTLLLAFTAALLCDLDALLRFPSSLPFWIVTLAHLALPFAAYYAIRQWPGGDDGPGLAWMFTVLPASWLSLASAVLATVLRLTAWRK